MQIGTFNEDMTISAIHGMPFVHAVYNCGILELKPDCSLAFSPDGIGFVTLVVMDTPEGWTPSKEIYFSDGVFSKTLCTVEIKTMVYSSTVVGVEETNIIEAYFGTINSPKIRKVDPDAHLCRILHQFVVLEVNLALYVCCSETILL